MKWQKLLSLLFSADDSKTSVTVWENILSSPERSYWVLSENGIVDRLWSYHSWDIEGKNIKKTNKPAKKTLKSCVFTGWYLANGSSESNNP